jgi:hypothetical protein
MYSRKVFAFEYPSPYVENDPASNTLIDVIYESPTTVVFEGEFIEKMNITKKFGKLWIL